MKLVLILFSLFAFTFAYPTEFEEEYGCSLKRLKICCWSNYNECCDPPSGPRTCPDKRTLCCKKRVYIVEEGDYEIEFYHG